jgi:uncharacterized membrane protein
MYTVDASITVDAAAAAAFECFDTPAEHPKLAPSLGSLNRTERLPDGRWHGEYGFDLSGVRLEGKIRTISREPGRALTFELTAGIRGIVRYRFADAGDGCRVTVSAEYELPACVVEAVGESVAATYADRELARVLANARARLEARRPSEPPDRA